jgi:hypothetical protein
LESARNRLYRHRKLGLVVEEDQLCIDCGHCGARWSAGNGLRNVAKGDGFCEENQRSKRDCAYGGFKAGIWLTAAIWLAWAGHLWPALALALLFGLYVRFLYWETRR